MKWILSVLAFSSAVYVAYSLCNACSSQTGAACVANNMFRLCVNGLPASSPTACPDGYVCADGPLCVPEGSVPAACGSCGQCNGTSTFACTGYNTFALCYGTTFPSSENYTCTGTLVCNVDSPTMCIDPLTTGIGGTCPYATTSTTTQAPTLTTPNPAVDPQAYCLAKGMHGRFDVTSDVTCRSYVYCVLYNGVWTGSLLQCVGQTLFNATSGLCQVGTPARCL